MTTIVTRIVLILALVLLGDAHAQEESYAVQFKISQTSSASAQTEWLASYEGKGKTAKFMISIANSSPSGERFSFSKGTFRRVAGSQPQQFLESLSLALGGKGKVPSAKKVEMLPFDLAVLGTKQSRASSAGGGFTSKPQGDWITMKIFLAQGAGEVYLNLNPAKGIGEFALKDEDYAEIVLRELRSVL